MWKYPPSIVLVITDDGNTLEEPGVNKGYTGLDHRMKNGRLAREWYEDLFTEASLFSAALYVYPNCHETFEMSPRLEEDALFLKARAQYYGLHTLAGRGTLGVAPPLLRHTQRVPY